MLVVETIAKIRRAYFSLGKPIKEICRELRVSRKVVRKVIRSNATEFRYERSRQPLPRIGPWRDRLEALLEENETRSGRERLTVIRLYEELRGLGYEGSYAAVRRYAIAWRQRRTSAAANAFVPLCFAAGEAYQFDSHGGPLGQELSFSRRGSFGHLFRLERLVLIVRAVSGLVSSVDDSLLAARMASARWGSRMQSTGEAEMREAHVLDARLAASPNILPAANRCRNIPA